MECYADHSFIKTYVDYLLDQKRKQELLQQIDNNLGGDDQDCDDVLLWLEFADYDYLMDVFDAPDCQDLKQFVLSLHNSRLKILPEDRVEMGKRLYDRLRRSIGNMGLAETEEEKILDTIEANAKKLVLNAKRPFREIEHLVRETSLPPITLSQSTDWNTYLSPLNHWSNYVIINDPYIYKNPEAIVGIIQGLIKNKEVSVTIYGLFEPSFTRDQLVDLLDEKEKSLIHLRKRDWYNGKETFKTQAERKIYKRLCKVAFDRIQMLLRNELPNASDLSLFTYSKHNKETRRIRHDRIILTEYLVLTSESGYDQEFNETQPFVSSRFYNKHGRWARQKERLNHIESFSKRL